MTTFLNKLTNLLSSRKRFRGVIECPASLYEICRGNVSKKLFAVKRQVPDTEFVKILSTLRSTSRGQFNDLDNEWVDLSKSFLYMQVNKSNGGLGLSNIQTACIFEELCYNLPLSMMLIAHKCWFVEPISEVLPDFLKSLTTNNYIGTLACNEDESGSDFQSQQSFFLDNTFTGTKSWVTNGDRANYFLVSGFIKETQRMALGVVSAEHVQKIDKMNVYHPSELGFCRIHFKNSKVSNILNDDNVYLKLTKMMLTGRRHVTETCSGLAKALLNEIVLFLREPNSVLQPKTPEQSCIIWKEAMRLTFVCESLAFYMCEIDWDNGGGIEHALASTRSIDICRRLMDILESMIDSRSIYPNQSYLSTLRKQLELLSHMGWSELVTRIYCGAEMIRHVASEDSEELRTKDKINHSISTLIQGAEDRCYKRSEQNLLLNGQCVFLYDIWQETKCPPFICHFIETVLVQLKASCTHLIFRDKDTILDEESENQQMDLVRLAKLGEYALSLLALGARIHTFLDQTMKGLPVKTAYEIVQYECNEATKFYHQLCKLECPQSELSRRVGKKLIQEGRYPISFPVQRLF